MRILSGVYLCDDGGTSDDLHSRDQKRQTWSGGDDAHVLCLDRDRARGTLRFCSCASTPKWVFLFPWSHNRES